MQLEVKKRIVLKQSAKDYYEAFLEMDFNRELRMEVFSNSVSS